MKQAKTSSSESLWTLSYIFVLLINTLNAFSFYMVATIFIQTSRRDRDVDFDGGDGGGTLFSYHPCSAARCAERFPTV